MSSSGDRDQVCRTLGLSGLAAAHQLILESIRAGTSRLVARGLNAARLQQLGYTAEGMQKLGFRDEQLIQLGYKGVGAKIASPEKKTPPPQDGNVSQQIRASIDAGSLAADLRNRGYQVDQVKRTGCSASELARLGYQLAELVNCCGVPELKRADFNARELGRYFSGEQLRAAGFSAPDMRLAGYAIRDLLRMGYPENQVRTAGFSTNELIREGLTKTTRI